VPRTVSIDCFHDHLADAGGMIVVAVDVIRATTTAVTAVALGRRCFPVPSIEATVPLAARLTDPLLAGELGGSQPYGFEIQNSPSALTGRTDPERPMILLSTSGTRLVCEAAGRGPTYLGCLRNVSALARMLAGRDEDVRLLGADSRGQFREEDQLCCTRIARALVEAGHTVADDRTAELIERWGDAPEEAILTSASVRYLKATGQERDLEFVLGHVDDLDVCFPVVEGEILMRTPEGFPPVERDVLVRSAGRDGVRSAGRDWSGAP
jgi:2-phosphosulfolactate phosphatase